MINNNVNIFCSRSEVQRNGGNGELRDDDLGKSSWYQPGLPRLAACDHLFRMLQLLSLVEL